MYTKTLDSVAEIILQRIEEVFKIEKTTMFVSTSNSLCVLCLFPVSGTVAMLIEHLHHFVHLHVPSKHILCMHIRIPVNWSINTATNSMQHTKINTVPSCLTGSNVRKL